MALKGNLREFSFIQLLNLINLAKKTGALYVERTGEPFKVIFREGKVAYAAIGKDTTNLLSILVSVSLITPTQESILAEKYKSMPDKEIGIHLINSGYLTQEQIFAGLEIYLIEFIREIFSWNEGVFHFDAGEVVPDEKIPAHLDVESLIIEGARKVQESEELKDEIPSLEMALKFTDRPGMNMRNVDLSVEEWRVVSYVDPKNSIIQIAKATKLNELEIRKVVYTLLQAGLVELVRPGGAAVSLSGRKFIVNDALQQKSLVSRLIDRIKSI
ncbi:MAG: DUF4388 domain-containing protein [Chloroflexi bacterium]|nr:DUF4388 domain-containing protein [Chloroflexota bacterium]